MPWLASLTWKMTDRAILPRAFDIRDLEIAIDLRVFFRNWMRTNMLFGPCKSLYL